MNERGPCVWSGMTIAWVLSGGASLGSIQVGMATALQRADVRPDLIVGTSVGALNGAWLAGGGDADELATIWRGLRRNDLFPVRPMLGLKAFLGQSRYFVPDRGLRRLLERELPHDDFDDVAIPFAAVATDIVSGTEVVIDSGSIVDAVIASSALPAVFPPVEIDDQLLVDGGVSNNTPISVAIDRGATEVWVLTPGYSCDSTTRPTNALDVSLRAIGVLIEQRFISELSHRHYDVPVHLVPAPCPIDISPIDFSHSDELIEASMAGTEQWLANGCPHAMPFKPQTPPSIAAASKPQT